MHNTILVLDAMGVIFAAADDVEDLLIPFVAEKGGMEDGVAIADLYLQASLGEMTAVEFWRAVGLSSEVEVEYLAGHRLTDGVLPFLDDLPTSVAAVWCLSNDVAEWSRQLRQLHHLESRFDGFVISGDAGVRKPDLRIYEQLRTAVGCVAADVLFVDDREKNLDAAHLLGMRTVQFVFSPAAAAGPRHVSASSFSELADLLEALALR